MFRFQRSGRAKNGKVLEAIKWAKEIAEYINSKYSQASFQVYIQVFGDIHAVYWCMDYKDLATYESIRAQLLSDEGYWAFVGKGMEWFIEGSFQDTLLSLV